jgi:hypothetical protein
MGLCESGVSGCECSDEGTMFRANPVRTWCEQAKFIDCTYNLLSRLPIRLPCITYIGLGQSQQMQHQQLHVPSVGN